MILKGSQRGNGSDLAVHLMNSYDNERVEIAEIHGAVADDLFGAFAELRLLPQAPKPRNTSTACRSIRRRRFRASSTARRWR